MSDDQQELRRVNWNEVLSVTHVFKSFQMARHLGKLALALAAVLLIWLWGGTLDLVTGWAGVHVPDEEIAQHASLSAAAFEKWTEKADKERAAGIEALWQEAHSQRTSLALFLSELGQQDGTGGHFGKAFQSFQEKIQAPNQPALPSEKDRAKLIEDDPAGALSKAQAVFEQESERIEKILEACEGDDGAAKTLKGDASLDTTEKKGKAEEKLEADLSAARRALTLRKIAMSRKVRKLSGATVFGALASYEGHCLAGALRAARRGNIAGGLAVYRKALGDRAALMKAAPPSHGLTQAEPTLVTDPPGFLYWCLMGLHGLGWLLCQHWLYAIAFLAVALAIWALFGGAMHRMSALHFARDEKISMTQALKFSLSKFFSFYFAPLIPLAIVLVIGLFMMLGGFVMSAPVGDLVMSLLFPLALLGGLLVSFLLIGLAAGGGLMYPTIAVESSDSFDAISRSFSYVFGKPWRAAFYGLVALIYGVICYLFVRLFAFLILSATHGFVGAGVLGGGETLSPAADKLDVMWPAPAFDNLLPAWQWEAMSGLEAFSSGILWVMVMPVALLVLAFLLSYCSSASTVIYFLLRQKVDATDLDDVYVEEPGEEELPIGEPAAEDESPAEEGEAPAEEEPAKPKRTRKKAAKKAKETEEEAPEEPQAPEE